MSERAMTAIDRPLGLGELLAETVRLYGERIRAVAAIGLFLAGTLVVADLTGHVVGFVAVVSLAFTAAYAATARVVAGDRFVEACAQVGLRVPILLVLTVVVALPFVLGRIDPVLVIFSVAWLAFVGFSIPVAMLERDPEGEAWYRRPGTVLYRSVGLARVEYLHALGIVAAFVITYLLLAPVLAALLVGFAENGRFAAIVIANAVIGPFFFLGLTVLYFEQRARALSSRREPT
jgi:hypothetical protein